MDKFATRQTMPIRSRQRKSILDAAARATSALADLGVEALVTGSLTHAGDSDCRDVGLLVVRWPRHVRHLIDGVVQEAFGSISCTVTFKEEPLSVRRSEDVHAVNVFDLVC